MSMQTAGPSGQDTVLDGRSRLARLMPPVVMLAVVALAAALPLLRNTIFYFWDDSAGSTVPVWRRIGEAVLDGRLPLMEPDMWRGGAMAAEASTGIFNPLMVAIAVGTYFIDNMALAITVAKIFFLLVLALGSFMLARSYGVRPWLAAAMGVAVPLASQTFYWDASSWMYSLMATSFIPWVWWSLHRAVHRGGSFLWVVVAGYLCVSLGNPYGLLATGLLVLGFIVEAWITKHRARIIGLMLSGGAVLLLAVPVFLPLLLSSSVGFRANSETWNNEFLSPNLSDLFAMSTPTAQPWLIGFGTNTLGIPAMYVAWFVLPLLPWMRWGEARRHWPKLVAAFIVGAAYLLLVLGPSQIWMFRWPLRLVTNLWFPVLLLWFFVANAGLERSRARVRAGLSFGLVFLGGWLAWSDIPDNRNRIVLGCVVVAALVALVVWRGLPTKSGVAALMAGSVAVLGLQLYYYPSMVGVTNYQFPTSQALIKERFAKYEGMTIQVAHTDNVALGDLVPAKTYQDMLFGSMYSAAGVESPSAYSGIGFTKMDTELCMIYNGSVCAQVWDKLWKPVPGSTATLANLMRAQTVVVQNSLVETRDDPPPAGWRRDRDAEATGMVTVYKRIDPIAHPQGTVADVTPGVQVSEDRKTSAVAEDLRFTKSGPGAAEITFTRLNWPGYTATVNGQSATVRTNSIGLVVVDLPAGAENGTVHLDFEVPGASISLVSVGIGGLLTIALIVFPAVARRRSRRSGPPAGDGPDDDVTELPEWQVAEPAGGRTT